MNRDVQKEQNIRNTLLTIFAEARKKESSVRWKHLEERILDNFDKAIKIGYSKGPISKVTE